MQTINNWHPETRALIKRLTDAGGILVRGTNGEDDFKFDGNLESFLDNLLACDEGAIWVKFPQRENAIWFSLVLGNSPGELVCDYADADETRELIDRLTSEHYDKWSERKQPTKTGDYNRETGKFVEAA